MTDAPVHTFQSSDPDLEVSEFADSKSSVLDELRALVAKPLPPDLISHHVPERPEWTMVYDTRFSFEQAKQIADAATSNGVYDALRGACLLLIASNVRIEKNGETVRGDDGNPLVLKSPLFKEVTGCLDQQSAVQAWFGRDQDILGHQSKIHAANDPDRRKKAPDPTV